MFTHMLLTMLVLVCAPAHAQSNLVPASNDAQRQADREAKAVQDAVVEGTTQLPRAIVKGGAMLQHSFGEGNSVLMMQGAKTVGTIVEGHVIGAQLLNAAVTEGKEGFWRAAGQVALDKSGQTAGEFAQSFFVNRAVSAGAGAVMAEGAAGLAFGVGWTAGKYVRESTGIGNTIDEFEFNHTPDFIKEAISGTPQVDTNDDWQRDQEAQARARIRAAAFESIQHENAVQQRQLDVARADAAMVAPTPEPMTTADGTFYGLNAVLNAMQANAARNATAEAAKAGACVPAKTLDPKTGCHPGHDEKAHPGGCKCG